MIVTKFYGDKIEPTTKKRLSSDGGDSNLTKLLKIHHMLDDIPNKAVDEQNRFRVLDNISGYLSEMKVATAVIETDYVDRDYLDDYVRFYSRCYMPYHRRCHRIHFFSAEYEKEFIERLLAQSDVRAKEGNDGKAGDDDFADFAKNYLGFVVIRPLPTGVVGRTCLKPYPNENGRRYTVLCDVKVSFFGREFTIRCMPFIQQDASTAVCAGCALWSTFMVTAQLFQHRRYCPGCITELAIGHKLSEKRNFPNDGLFIRDMVYAIRGVGLEPICLAADNKTSVDRVHQLGSIYAYLSAGLPIVLTGALLHGDDSDEGEHAVVVNGYHMLECSEDEGENGSFLLSDRIDKIYVHDDQIGPGARMSKPYADPRRRGLTWTTDWRDGSTDKGNLRMEVHTLLIPAYHKIRVDFEMILNRVEEFENGLKKTLKQMSDDPKYDRLLPEEFKGKVPLWDIRLLTAKSFKQEIRQDDESMTQDEKLEILKKGYPRFVWDVNLLMNGKREIRFLVDATDSGRNLCILDILTYRQKMARICMTMVGDEWPGKDLKNNPLVLKLREKMDEARKIAGKFSTGKDLPLPRKPLPPVSVYR